MEAPASGMSTESKPGVTFSLAHYQRNPSASDQPQDNLPYPSANLAYLGQVVQKVPEVCSSGDCSAVTGSYRQPGGQGS